jgi:pilus assembly protein Flp/PilA
MGHFLRSVGQVLKSEDGVAAVEYAVLLALIVGACLSSMTDLGLRVNGIFLRVADALATANR